MHTIKSTITLMLVVLALLISSSCAKDKLTEDLEIYKGRYTWQYSQYKQDWWSSSYTTIKASDASYMAEIEFNGKGKIIFYIDGDEIHKTGYSIVNQEWVNDDKTMSLQIDPRIEDTKELDLKNEIGFTLTGDTLSVDDFPGGSYDSQLSGTNYFTRN